MPQATPAAVTKACKDQASSNTYKPDANGTKCSQFLRDLASGTFSYTGFNNMPANSIHEEIRTSGDWVRHFSSKGNSAISRTELEAAFKTAQDDANEGYLVVVAMRIGDVGKYGGHCAAVVPGQLTASGGYAKADLASTVPFIAQAGTDVFDGKALSYGFTPADFKKYPVIVASNRV